MTRTFWRFWRADRSPVIWLLAVSIVLASSATGCEYGPDVTWVNQTDHTVLVYSGEQLGDFDTALPPHSSKKLAMADFLWDDVVVLRDEQGNVLFRQELTWDEFKAMGFRFVITEDMLSPTPTAGW
jgi:hypothetical protein